MRELKIADKVVYLTEKRDDLTTKEKVVSFIDNLLLGKGRKRARDMEFESRLARIAGRIDRELTENLETVRGHMAARVREIVKDEFKREA